MPFDGLPRLQNPASGLIVNANNRLVGENFPHLLAVDWPASFPSAAPVFSLDRVYARDVRVLELSAHFTRAAQRASDHLPVIARVRLPG